MEDSKAGTGYPIRCSSQVGGNETALKYLPGGSVLAMAGCKENTHAKTHSARRCFVSRGNERLDLESGN
jgi:hypothetical protein